MFLSVLNGNQNLERRTRDEQFRADIILNPGTSYTPTWDGKMLKLTIDDGSTITINQPSNRPPVGFAECVLVIQCVNKPCVVKTGTWEATDGLIVDINLSPGENKFYYFYHVNNLWTAKGCRQLDDERVQNPPITMGINNNAKFSDVLNNIEDRLNALQNQTVDAGVSSISVGDESVTGDVLLHTANGITITGEDNRLQFSLDRSQIPAVTQVTAGGVTTTANHITIAGINGIAATATTDGNIIISKQASTGGTSTTTTTTTIPALVYSDSPLVSGTTDVLAPLTQAPIVLGEFSEVGDIQVVTIDGRIDYTAGSSKNPVWTFDINGTTTALTGPSLSASTSGRRYVLKGYLLRKDATTLTSVWCLRMSNTGGTYDAAGDWASTTTTPGGSYLKTGEDATVSNWKTATILPSVSWSADGGETKALVAESITIERLGRDSDSSFTQSLLVTKGVLTGDVTGTTPTQLASATIPANTLDKNGSMVELLVCVRLNATSTTPTATFTGTWGGSDNIAVSALQIGNTGVANHRVGLVSVFVRRLSNSTARITARYIVGTSGSGGSLSSAGASREQAGVVITGVDWGVAQTFGLNGTLSSTTGSPHILVDWFHARRWSDAFGRAAFVDTPISSTYTTIIDASLPANTFNQNGVKVLLQTFGATTYSSSNYINYRLTVGTQQYTLGQNLTSGFSSLEAFFTIQRVSGTQLRVVFFNYYGTHGNTKAQSLLTIDPSLVLTVKLEVSYSGTNNSILLETAGLSMIGGGGEIITTTVVTGSAYTDLTQNSATPAVRADRELFRTQNTTPTTITNFPCDGLYEGYRFLLIINDANTTINNSTNIKTKASGVRAQYDVFDVLCFNSATPIWIAMLQDNT